MSTLAELPEPVRARIAALAAAVLPQVPDLPAPLRRVAAFAPARRARSGGTAILAVLDQETESETGLRAQVAAQLRSAGIEAGAEPADAAAYAWLSRPDGWSDQVGAAVEALEARPSVAEQDLVRLQRRVEVLEADLAESRERRRSEAAAAKQEHTVLRRRLGEARASGKEALAGIEETIAAAEAARAEAEASAEALAREVRQLRARVAQLESEAGEDRRAARTERESATLRTRLLLDTLLEASSGLQRELGLPPASSTPGEAAEAGYAVLEAPEPGRTRGVASIGELEGYLAMPRARLIIDGYNVTKQAWPSSALDAQRIRLMQALAPLVARTGAETTVVFDAATVPGAAARHVAGAPRGVRVLFSPPGVIADDVIRDLVAAEPAGRVLLVVSDDQAVARDVALSGGRPVPTGLLLQAVR
ncbi:MAG: NYN domain-containing protein [Nocardioides sp.]